MTLVQTGLVTVDLIDYASETQQHSFNSVLLNAGNFAAQDTLFQAYLTALGAITIANVYKDSHGNQDRNVPKNPASSQAAHREYQWGVVFKDLTTGQRFTFRIAAPQLAPNLKPGEDHADLTATDIAAYVSAFEALAKSPNGNAVQITDMVVVGKNDRAPNFPR